MPPAARRVVRRTPTAPISHAPNGRPLDYGVPPGASVAVVAALLKYDRDTEQPFCTCTGREAGFGFDPQIGVFVHAIPSCWKPSKPMYAAALQGGVLEPPIDREQTAEQPQGRRVVRRPRRPVADTLDT